MLKKKIIVAVVGILLLGGGTWVCDDGDKAFAEGNVIWDSPATHLGSVKVDKIIEVHSLQDIRQALEEARSKGLKISISGARHAQGGQQSYPNDIVLDMMGFNEILAWDKARNVIRVQSGVTWKQLQDYINPYGDAVTVMQTKNIFTVGGSLSSNIHGDDPQYGSIIETVRSFHLMLADGRVINVSRQENPELFGLVIGGYGLFGVIIDVDLLLTGNALYKENTVFMGYTQLPAYFQSHIQNNAQISWFAAYSIEPKKGDIEMLKVTTYSKFPGDNMALAGLPARKRKGYKFRTETQSQLNRYDAGVQVVLQEYFIPINKFVSFVDGLKKIFGFLKGMSDSGGFIDAWPWVIRYEKQDKQSFLPYAKADSLSFEVLIFLKESVSAQRLNDIHNWVRQAVDLSVRCGGTFYLTKTALYPDREQLLKAYPEFNEFIKKKKKYDPQSLFMSQFYDHYSR